MPEWSGVAKSHMNMLHLLVSTKQRAELELDKDVNTILAHGYDGMEWNFHKKCSVFDDYKIRAA